MSDKSQMSNDNVVHTMFDPIGQTVDFWLGGDGGGTATILSKCKKIKYNKGMDYISTEIGRDNNIFLARRVDEGSEGRLCFIEPYLYYSSGYPYQEGMFLQVKWQASFKYGFPKNDETRIWAEQDLEGLEYEIPNE